MTASYVYNAVKAVSHQKNSTFALSALLNAKSALRIKFNPIKFCNFVTLWRWRNCTN